MRQWSWFWAGRAQPAGLAGCRLAPAVAPTPDDEEALASVRGHRGPAAHGGRPRRRGRGSFPAADAARAAARPAHPRAGARHRPHRRVACVGMLPLHANLGHHGLLVMVFCTAAGELFLRAFIRRTAQRLAEGSIQYSNFSVNGATTDLVPSGRSVGAEGSSTHERLPHPESSCARSSLL